MSEQEEDPPINVAKLIAAAKKGVKAAIIKFRQ